MVSLVWRNFLIFCVIRRGGRKPSKHFDVSQFHLNRKTRVGPAAGLLTRSPRYPQTNKTKCSSSLLQSFMDVHAPFSFLKKIESSVVHPCRNCFCFPFLKANEKSGTSQTKNRRLFFSRLRIVTLTRTHNRDIISKGMQML